MKIDKTIVVPRQPVKLPQDFMTFSKWSNQYVYVRQLYALVG